MVYWTILCIISLFPWFVSLLFPPLLHIASCARFSLSLLTMKCIFSCMAYLMIVTTSSAVDGHSHTTNRCTTLSLNEADATRLNTDILLFRRKRSSDFNAVEKIIIPTHFVMWVHWLKAYRKLRFLIANERQCHGNLCVNTACWAKADTTSTPLC